MRRLPMPHPPVGTVPAGRVRPLSPYQVIAVGLRTGILDGTLPPGTALPTVKQRVTRNHVAPSTAHHAIAVLARERLVTVSRGRRATSNHVQGASC